LTIVVVITRTRGGFFVSGITKADLEKPFTITSLCRKDLLVAGIPREIVESLSDTDMTTIVAGMEDEYVPLMFEESLKYQVERRLKKRQIVPSTPDQ
jgi:hypothetical protein